VAFDFDGTLTVRDSFTAFLTWRTPVWRLVSGLLELMPAAVRYGLDRDRERMKTAAVAQFLAGAPVRIVAAEAEAFEHILWRRLLRPDALEAWRGWGEKGAVRAIVTASPEIVVEPFARRLGADRLIGTRLGADGEGRLTGRLEGRNCRGAEKARRLREAFGDRLSLAAAYGDSAGDREMLDMAQTKGYRVFRRRP
jgi:phosphatidylglycerophosphatase C